MIMKDKRGPAGGVPVFDPVTASEDLGLTVEEFVVLLPKATTEINFRLGEVRRGLDAGDLHEATLNAHTLKSVAATLGAERVRRAALEMELCAKEGDDVARCIGLLPGLEERAVELLAAIDSF